jgi:hypothetical protein
MSSDRELERLLGEVRQRLPEPDAAASRRARAGALAAFGQRPRRRAKTALLVGVALVAAVALGSVLGASVAPSGTAASGPVRLGFVPEPGWNALQAAAPSTAGQPLVAMAANVSFAPEDAVLGLAEPSTVPYATLNTLPPNGVVIVVSLISSEPPPNRLPLDLAHSQLRIADAVPYIELGVNVRPERPLGQYQIGASGDGWSVDAHVYFGTPSPSAALLAEAQRQLDALVVREARVGIKRPAARLAQIPNLQQPASPVRPAVTKTIDRTFACTPSFGQLKVVVSPHGTPELIGSRFLSSGYARATRGSDTDPAGDLAVIAKPGLRNGGTQFPGAAYVNRLRCAASRVKVPLGHAGLPGPPAAYRSDAVCKARAKVLVRIRAEVDGASSWRRLGGEVGRSYTGVRGRVVSGELAVRDQQTGKPLAYATLGPSGATRHWSAVYPRCS